MKMKMKTKRELWRMVSTDKLKNEDWDKVLQIQVSVLNKVSPELVKEGVRQDLITEDGRGVMVQTGELSGITGLIKLNLYDTALVTFQKASRIPKDENCVKYERGDITLYCSIPKRFKKE